MKKDEVINKLVHYLSSNYQDFKGLYFFGSRAAGSPNIYSDFDIILLFDTLDYYKELDIAGIIAQVEYEEKAEIDYRLFTVTGKKSIDYIRNNVNPIFIKLAVDNGLYYGRILKSLSFIIYYQYKLTLKIIFFRSI